jgi:hypothetical protein
VEKVKEIINRTGEFNIVIYEKIIQLTGTLRFEGSDLILECQTSKECAKEINQLGVCQVYGIVAGTEITLLDGYITVIYKQNNNTDYIGVCIDPSEIVIGRSYSKEIKIKKISSAIMALNHMFSAPVLNQMHSFKEEKLLLLNYTHTPSIIAKDSRVEISLFQTFSNEWETGKITYRLIPVIEFVFSEAIGIADAIAQIASVRNLFSFFADFYLPLENITFADEKSKIYDDQLICDCTLLMNHREEVDILTKPFLISTSQFQHSFNDIWHSWSEFYRETKYIAVLFYEIISNRSTRINRFINLVQALEIYSNYYRIDEARKIAEADGWQNNKKFGTPPLKYHLEGILLYLNSCFEIDTHKIKKFAKKISDMRNFLTHFNRRKYDEPSYQELTSANRVLRFVLLAIVYKTVGIADVHIKKCMQRIDYNTFNQDIEIVMRQNRNTVYASMFDD